MAVIISRRQNPFLIVKEGDPGTPADTDESGLAHARGGKHPTPTPVPTLGGGEKWVSTSNTKRTKGTNSTSSPPPPKTFGGLKLCYGKERYRFPGHYLVPKGIQGGSAKSESVGLPPGQFAPSKEGAAELWAWLRHGAQASHAALNNRKEEVLDFYVSFAAAT